MAFTIITTNKITILFFVLLLLGCSKATIDAEIKEETPTAETSLKEYAAAKGKFIGNLMRDGMFDN